MEALDFKIAFKYPFNRAKGMWNMLWVFLPIVGWLALGGYGVRIINEFIKGKFKQLPTFEFSDDMSLGFYMFLKAIPFSLAYMIVIAILERIDPFLAGLANFFVSLFVVPILAINFVKKQTVGSFFEFKIVKVVFSSLQDYIVVILKSFLLAIVFGFMFIILVGIPAGAFTKNIFLADFYRRKVKSS